MLGALSLSRGIRRASDRGVEWVDFVIASLKNEQEIFRFLFNPTQLFANKLGKVISILKKARKIIFFKLETLESLVKKP
jgi:hypothetical protein